MDEKKLQELILNQGARSAAVVLREQILLDAEFRSICARNSCGCYGRSWTCPPDAGEISALMERVRSFDKGILYQSVGQLEDSFDIEGMLESGKSHARLSRRIHGALPEDFRRKCLHLSCGACQLCSRCAKLDDLPCRFPDKALLSMEACGIDVYRTAKNAGMPYHNGQNTVTYFGIVLFTEAPNVGTDHSSR